MNIRKVQQLLTLLGQELEIDGLDGPQTQGALDAAIRALGGDVDFWDGIVYFQRQEFACKCGRYCNGFPAEPDEGLVTLADKVRAHFGAPMTVTSGVRCKRHNANVGGVSNSRHLAGKAVDFAVRGLSAASVLDYVNTLDVNYAYAIDGGTVHMDVR